MKLSGVQKLLFKEQNEISDEESTTSASIFGQAQAIQAAASNFRFGKTVRTIRGTNMSTPSQKNLSKAGQIQAER